MIEKEAKKWRGKEKKEANNGNSFFPICIWESWEKKKHSTEALTV